MASPISVRSRLRRLRSSLHPFSESDRARLMRRHYNDRLKGGSRTAQMEGWIAVTHSDWFDFLARRRFWTEVNF